MDKRWNIREGDHDEESRLQVDLKIHPILCRLLVQRGVHTYEEARQFFRPSLDGLHSPWLMKDMEIAVDRILSAIHRNEKILVYGDYDVDGTTAVSLVYCFLRELTTSLEYYIPHRQREGYGLSQSGIDYAITGSFNLVIALDCGIKAIRIAKYAKEAGIDLIICDHHLPDKILPDALAILNPRQTDCGYPFKDLTGCGIGFKLVSALAERTELPPDAVYPFLDLVATSIASDIVPVTGENRILAYYGLEKVNHSPCPAIRALIIVSNLKKKLVLADLAFMIAPRLNAAGRIDDARKAVELCIEKQESRALQLAAGLQTDNTERKSLDEQITREALALMDELPQAGQKTTVVYQPHWHKGVIGIVASRLMETYYRPTIVLTQSNGMITGSARSVRGFNIYQAIHECRALLENYGGHFYAAGITLKPENIPAFQNRFEEVVAQQIDPDLLIPQISIDAEIRIRDISASFFRILHQFEPFGPSNHLPVFLARRVRDTGHSRIVGAEHIRFEVQQDDSEPVSGIGFNMAAKFHTLSGQKPFDIVFSLEENTWNGNTRLELKIRDIRPGV